MDEAQWSEEEFGRAELGDLRRANRLVAMGASVAAKPAGNITAVFAVAAEREGAFRFVENDGMEGAKVTRAAARAPYPSSECRLHTYDGGRHVPFSVPASRSTTHRPRASTERCATCAPTRTGSSVSKLLAQDRRLVRRLRRSPATAPLETPPRRRTRPRSDSRSACTRDGGQVGLRRSHRRRVVDQGSDLELRDLPNWGLEPIASTPN